MIQGADSPLILCTVTKYKVMKISDIIDAIDGEIVARGLYLVRLVVELRPRVVYERRLDVERGEPGGKPSQGNRTSISSSF